MPNLDKLSLHLKNPETKDAKIDVVEAERNGETVPNTHLILKMQQETSKMIIL